MDKLVSEEILPPSKRSSASSKELLSCLEELEREIYKVFEDPLYKMYTSNVHQIESLCESLEKLDIKIDSEEKDFDRWLRYIEKAKTIGEGTKWLKENSSISTILLEKKKTSATDRGVKN